VITFDSSGCHIQDKNSLKMIGSIEMQDRLYIFRVPSYQNLQIKPIKSPHITNTVNYYKWSRNPLTFSIRACFKQIYWCYQTYFFLLNIKNILFVMFVILQSKRLPFPLSAYRSKKYLHLIHVDVWEPYSISLIHGHKYLLTIVDYSRYTWIFPLK